MSIIYILSKLTLFNLVFESILSLAREFNPACRAMLNARQREFAQKLFFSGPS